LAQIPWWPLRFGPSSSPPPNKAHTLRSNVANCVSMTEALPPATNVNIDGLREGSPIIALNGRVEIEKTSVEDRAPTPPASLPPPATMAPSRNPAWDAPPPTAPMVDALSAAPTTNKSNWDAAVTAATSGRPQPPPTQAPRPAFRAAQPPPTAQAQPLQKAPLSMPVRTTRGVAHRPGVAQGAKQEFRAMIADGEWRIMMIALCTFFGAAALPVLGAVALLFDQNYRFWVGYYYPFVLLAIIFTLCIALVLTFTLLHKYAPEYLHGEQTLALISCIFTASLGITLVLISLPESREMYEVGHRIGHGCMNSNTDSSFLMDYDQVLYQIKMQPSCRGQDSVQDCQGWEANRYTRYIEYLEYEFQCGPVCPEVPMPVPETLFTASLPGPVPAPAPAPAPAAEEEGGGSFLQDVVRGGKHERLDEHHGGLHKFSSLLHTKALLSVDAPGDPMGSMWLSNPQQVRSTKLFSPGATRTSCYSLVSTRLQVLAWCFGDLMFWEGVGLMIVSLLLSFFAFIEQCLHSKPGVVSH